MLKMGRKNYEGHMDNNKEGRRERGGEGWGEKTENCEQQKKCLKTK